jgi:Ca2+-binding EF-hand superfamily protein
LIKRADTDHDGVVSEEEFYAIMTRKVWTIDWFILYHC